MSERMMNGSVPMIRAKILELRRKVGGLKAGKTAAPFPVKSSKELMIKLREALDELELIAPVVDQRITVIEQERGTMCHVVSTVRVQALDGSFIDMVGSGHGADKDDKAGGKASTYAWKDALLKGLSIPEKDMLDTDNEAGHGEKLKKGRGKGPDEAPPPAQHGTGSDWAGYADRIRSITTLAALDKAKAALLKLPPEAQLALTPIWDEQRATIIRGEP